MRSIACTRIWGEKAMAGIGFELRKIYGRKTLASNIWGTLYATMTSIGPSIVTAVLLLGLKTIMDRSGISELESRFFISSFTYVFLISILVSAFFNATLSRYISDCIFTRNERDICASVYGVLTVGTAASGIIMLALCAVMYIKDGVPFYFLVIYYLLGVLVTNVYNLMTYVSALKEYKEVTLSFFLGLLLAAAMYALCRRLEVHVVIAAYLALICGYFLIAFMLTFWCVRAFGAHSSRYFAYLYYFRKYPRLAISNLAYMLGFYATTIIYWSFADIREQVGIFATAPSYDQAFFLAIMVNMPALVLFVVRVETAFFDKFTRYLSSLNSGSYDQIEKERMAMNNTLRYQLFFVYELQLIICVVLICLANVLFPYLNISSQVLNTFMVLSMGLYAVFCMYFTIVFLYYFEDHTSACIASCVFLAVTVVTALVAAFFGKPWYPLPMLFGGLSGWTVAFVLLRRRINKLNGYLMCRQD